MTEMKVLRTLLIVFFLLLALIAPVWIPVRTARAMTSRPAATRLEEDE
jgi:hypothetical protein